MSWAFPSTATSIGGAAAAKNEATTPDVDMCCLPNDFYNEDSDSSDDEFVQFFVQRGEHDLALVSSAGAVGTTGTGGAHDTRAAASVGGNRARSRTVSPSSRPGRPITAPSSLQHPVQQRMHLTHPHPIKKRMQLSKETTATTARPISPRNSRNTYSQTKELRAQRIQSFATTFSAPHDEFDDDNYYFNRDDSKDMNIMNKSGGNNASESSISNRKYSHSQKNDNTKVSPSIPPSRNNNANSERKPKSPSIVKDAATPTKSTTMSTTNRTTTPTSTAATMRTNIEKRTASTKNLRSSPTSPEIASSSNGNSKLFQSLNQQNQPSNNSTPPSTLLGALGARSGSGRRSGDSVAPTQCASSSLPAVPALKDPAEMPVVSSPRSMQKSTSTQYATPTSRKLALSNKNSSVKNNQNKYHKAASSPYPSSPLQVSSPLVRFPSELTSYASRAVDATRINYNVHGSAATDGCEIEVPLDGNKILAPIVVNNINGNTECSNTNKSNAYLSSPNNSNHDAQESECLQNIDGRNDIFRVSPAKVATGAVGGDSDCALSPASSSLKATLASPDAAKSTADQLNRMKMSNSPLFSDGDASSNVDVVDGKRKKKGKTLLRIFKRGGIGSSDCTVDGSDCDGVLVGHGNGIITSGNQQDEQQTPTKPSSSGKKHNNNVPSSPTFEESDDENSSNNSRDDERYCKNEIIEYQYDDFIGDKEEWPHHQHEQQQQQQHKEDLLEKHKRRRRRKFILAMAILIFLAGVVVALIMTTKPRGGSEQKSSSLIIPQPKPFRPQGNGPSYKPPINKGGDYCEEATSTDDTTLPKHILPLNSNNVVSRIAFASCFVPQSQTTSKLWKHVRNTFQPDVWIWLGDNVYGRTTHEMSVKRWAYTAAKLDYYYTKYGPLGEPKIPVVATWDNNDYAKDDIGDEYQCQRSTQGEFARYFDLPPEDPRHPSQGDNQQNGIYSSYIFAKPTSPTQPNDDSKYGVHIILLDSRMHRSPMEECDEDHTCGPCMGGNSTMLGTAQWEWLEYELLSENKTSDVKVIGNGVQVLPTSYRGKSKDDYCSYDGEGGTFDDANWDLGEGSWIDPENENPHEGTIYRSWANMPNERRKLLRLAQRSINEGRSKQIIFLAGDQHWGEIEVKKMTSWSGGDDENGNAQNTRKGTYHGKSRLLYGVTASGIERNFEEDHKNSHRVRVRTADNRGNGVFTKECKFPFRLLVNGELGEEYHDCADVFGTGFPSCATKTSRDNAVVSGRWGQW